MTLRSHRMAAPDDPTRDMPKCALELLLEQEQHRVEPNMYYLPLAQLLRQEKRRAKTGVPATADGEGHEVTRYWAYHDPEIKPNADESEVQEFLAQEQISRALWNSVINARRFIWVREGRMKLSYPRRRARILLRLRETDRRGKLSGDALVILNTDSRHLLVSDKEVVSSGAPVRKYLQMVLKSMARKRKLKRLADASEKIARDYRKKKRADETEDMRLQKMQDCIASHLFAAGRR